MIRPTQPEDEAAIRACARAAYRPYIAAIGREPAPIRADYRSQIAAGHVFAAIDENDRLQGFIVFYPRERYMPRDG